MYYLFIKNKKDIEKYKADFIRVKSNINKGKTPVFSEIRCAKTNVIESLPYNCLLGVFMVVGAILLEQIKLNEIVKVAIVLVVNSVFGAISNFIFTISKHQLRKRLCKKLDIEPSEENIAVMESLEYQSV